MPDEEIIAASVIGWVVLGLATLTYGLVSGNWDVIRYFGNHFVRGFGATLAIILLVMGITRSKISFVGLMNWGIVGGAIKILNEVLLIMR